MNREEKQKGLESLDKAIQALKENQKLIMGCLTSYLDNGLEEKDLKIVKWAYTRRFKMLQHDKHIISSKREKN